MAAVDTTALRGMMEHFRAEAHAAAGLDELEMGDLMRAFVARLGTGEHLKTSERRYVGFLELKSLLPLLPRYDTVVFYMTALTEDDDGTEGLADSIYAITFWESEATTPAYVTQGGTFVSHDGEYRKNISRWTEYEEICQKVRDEEENEPYHLRLFDTIDAKTLELVRGGELNLSLRVYSSSPERDDELTGLCDDQRLMIRLFVSQAFLSGGMMQAPHIQPVYAKAMKYPRTRFSETLELLKFETRLDDDEDRRRAYKRSTRLRAVLMCGSGKPTWSCGGIKLTPLSRAAFTQWGNIRHPVWVESWMAERMTDLTINGVSGFFPVQVARSVVGAGSQLFDNDAMHKHYLSSWAATAALKHVRAARDVVRDSKGVSERTEALDRACYVAAAEAERQVLTDHALLTLTQHVGATIGTLPHVPTVSKFYTHAGGDTFDTIIFTLMFSCLGMHRYGIHGDLHVHNMTCRMEWSDETGKRVGKVCGVFVAGPDGERDTFVVPLRGSSGCIIDFSRTVVSPACMLSLEASQQSEYVTVFFREQATTRMYETLARWAADMLGEPACDEAKFVGAALSKPQAMYDVMSAVDYLAIGRSLGTLLANSARAGAAWPVSDRVVSLCASIRMAAREELLQGLQHVVLGAETDVVYTPAAIGRRILGAAFPGWHFNRWDPAELELYTPVDAYNAYSPVTYRSADPKTFPPWAKLETLKKMAKGLRQEVYWPRDPADLEAALGAHARGDPHVRAWLAAERDRLAPPPL